MRSMLTSRLALATLLAFAATATYAKTTTINDITLDVPDGFETSSSNRGILVKTPDGEVDVWVEAFKGADTATLMDEHAKYWAKEKVELNGDGDRKTSNSGDINVVNIDYPKATWKGDPTVVRYTAVGPLGPDHATVLTTYWASPGGDKQFGGEIQTMLNTLQVKLAQ